MRPRAFTLLIFLLILQAARPSQARALDLDHDGMSDVWQQVYSIATGDGSSDSDGDGFTNAEEAIAGTNPHDPADFPCISSVSRVLNPTVYTTTVSVVWHSRPGLMYTVEHSEDLINWTANSPIRSSTGTVTTWVSTYSSWLPRKFFRLTVSQQDALDSDGDGLLDWEEQLLGTYPLYPDTDGDGMPDEWEVVNHLNPLADDSGSDPDGDQLTNLDEYLNGSDPQVFDSGGGGGGGGPGGTPTQATEASYTWVTNTASFTYGSVDQGHFVSGTYFLDNFAQNAHPGEEDGHIYYLDFQTEIWGQQSRAVNDDILNDAMNAYSLSFRTAPSTPVNDARRWQKTPAIGAAVSWHQAAYPDQEENVTLTDSSKDTAFSFLSVQLNSLAAYTQEMSRPIVIIDYPLLPNGSIDSTQNPQMYSGSVTFTVKKWHWLPDSCQINVGNLPSGILSQIAVVSSVTPRSPSIAVQIKLVPPSPNTQRVLLDVDMLQPTITSTGTAGNLDPVGGIRLCRWNSPRDATGVLEHPETFPNADHDRLVIHLQLPHKSGSGTVTVHVSTIGAAGAPGGANASYNDAGANLTLTETNTGTGIFESLPIAIVADKDDDQWSGGRAIEGALNDPTFIGWPGGTVQVMGTDLPTTLQFPIKKFTHSFTTSFIYAGDMSGNDVPDAIANALIRLPEIYAPLHMRVDKEHADGTLSQADLAQLVGTDRKLRDAGISTLIGKIDAQNIPPDTIKIVFLDTSIISDDTENIITMGQCLYAKQRPDIVIVYLSNLTKDGAPKLESAVLAHECGHTLRGYGHSTAAGVYLADPNSMGVDLPYWHLMAKGGGFGIHGPANPDKDGKHWYVSDSAFVLGRVPYSKPINP